MLRLLPTAEVRRRQYVRPVERAQGEQLAQTLVVAEPSGDVQARVAVFVPQVAVRLADEQLHHVDLVRQGR